MDWSKYSISIAVAVGFLLGAGFILPILWPFGIAGMALCAYFVKNMPWGNTGIGLFIAIYTVKYLLAGSWVSYLRG